jgi:Tol biopolymer transport system component
MMFRAVRYVVVVGTVAVAVAVAVASAAAPAGVDVGPSTLMFASAQKEVLGQPSSPDTVADLYLLRGGSVVRRVTHTALWEEYPAWSPDGRRVAFSKGDPFCHSNSCENRPLDGSIWVQNLKGSAPRRLTRPGQSVIDRSPVWSPDGRTIAFARADCCEAGETDGIYTIAPDGRNQKRVYAAAIQALDWSPDGSALAILSESGRVRLLDVESGEAPRLAITNIGSGKSDVAWSPKGDKLAIATAVGIYVVAVDGGRARRVVKARGEFSLEISGGVSWSPDGRTLAFGGAMGTDPEARSDIFVVGVNGRGLRRLTTNPGPDFDPAWRR